MFYHAKNGCLDIDNTTMDYLSFGTGTKHLIMIPGLGDGLKTAKGMAIPFAMMYKMFAKKYTVHVFSRKNELQMGYTTRDMAADVKHAMELCGIEKASVIGVSQGGMIAQHLAIDYPETIEKLALIVTVPRKNEIVETVISNWIELAKEDKLHEIMQDMFQKMYTPEFIKKNPGMAALAERFSKPKSYDRFVIMAQACISHDAYDKLSSIKVPTLVIGGELDETVGAQSSRDIAEKIEHAELFMYQEYGHGLYEEAKDFNQRIYDFLEK